MSTRRTRGRAAPAGATGCGSSKVDQSPIASHAVERAEVRRDLGLVARRAIACMVPRGLRVSGFMTRCLTIQAGTLACRCAPTSGAAAIDPPSAPSNESRPEGHELLEPVAVGVPLAMKVAGCEPVAVVPAADVGGHPSPRRSRSCSSQLARCATVAAADVVDAAPELVGHIPLAGVREQPCGVLGRSDPLDDAGRTASATMIGSRISSRPGWKMPVWRSQAHFGSPSRRAAVRRSPWSGRTRRSARRGSGRRPGPNGGARAVTGLRRPSRCRSRRRAPGSGRAATARMMFRMLPMFTRCASSGCASARGETTAPTCSTKSDPAHAGLDGLVSVRSPQRPRGSACRRTRRSPPGRAPSGARGR